MDAAEDKSRDVGFISTEEGNSGVVVAPADEPDDVEFVVAKVVNSDVVDVSEDK